MAQAHARLGSRVTVIEAGRILAREDRDLVTPLVAGPRAEGITILENCPAGRVSAAGGLITVQTGQGPVTGSHVLIATGRRPAMADLDLVAAGVAMTAAGVTVGPGLRSTNRRIYAIGDAAGQGQFTHLAGAHAGVVIRQILLGLPARVRRDHIPRVTYSDPALAQVGLTEAEARAAHGRRLTILRLPFAETDRAVVDRCGEGLIKVMVVRGRPVGVAILGRGADDLIGIWGVAIANGLKMGALATMIVPYPTLGEINKRVAGTYFSTRLFGNPWVHRMVRIVQAVLP